MTLAQSPRVIDADKTFESIVSWIAATATREKAPGVIVGLSGTDSILTFLACSKAFERMGKPHRVLGLNFEHTTKNELVDESKPFQCVKSEFNWVAQDIFPWLRAQAPQAQLEIDSSIPHSDDNKRWGHLFSRAVRDVGARQGLANRHYFPVGTRNATEQALGTYSQISKNVSMLPIVGLYKSEVIELCEYLGVPQIAIDKSREIDCDCGRFATQANYMREVDLFIMYKNGLLPRAYLEQNIPTQVLREVGAFYYEETLTNSYRDRTPYIPESRLAVIKP